MNQGTIFSVFRKELIDTLRDRRTIISTIVIPTLMFPVLTLGFGSLMARSVQRVQRETASVMLLGAEHAPALAETIRQTDGLEVVTVSSDYVARINDKKLRVAIEFPPGFERDLQAGGRSGLAVTIYHYAGEIRSQSALRAVQKLLRDYSDQLVAKHLNAHGLSRDVLKPFASREQNVAEPKKVGGNIIGGLFPYLIIFLCFMGAMAPAIDLTTGEKERGTIETILASAAGRVEIVAGKFLMVFTASVVTSLVSLTSFALTFSLPFLGARQFGQGSRIPFEISLGGIAGVFVLVLPLAVMFSAGLLALGLFARTSKEAQSYSSPLIFLVIMPAMAAMLPGFDLNWKLALTPILNVSLVSKEVLTGSYPWGLIAMVFGSSCLYALGALSLAVAAFKRESVLFRT